MSIFEIRNSTELAQYSVKKALITTKAFAGSGEATDEEISVMLDIIIALLHQSHSDLDGVVANITEYGRREAH